MRRRKRRRIKKEREREEVEGVIGCESKSDRRMGRRREEKAGEGVRSKHARRSRKNLTDGVLK